MSKQCSCSSSYLLFHLLFHVVVFVLFGLLLYMLLPALLMFHFPIAQATFPPTETESSTLNIPKGVQ